MALSVTHDPSLADDVAQEAFLRAWRSAATYDGLRGSVSAWLLTITRNAAIDAVRARRLVPADNDSLDRLLQRHGINRLPTTAVPTTVAPALATGEKCQRCWQVLPEVAASPEHLCRRCTAAVAALDAR